MIRGLALRSLTSLRIPSILEYVMPPLKVRMRGEIGVASALAGTTRVTPLCRRL